MSDKYIIKNCELICNGECPNSKTGYCQDCTDCPLKQIVDKCTKAIEIYANNNFYDDDRDRFMGESFMAEKILELLDIEEVE